MNNHALHIRPHFWVNPGSTCRSREFKRTSAFVETHKVRRRLVEHLGQGELGSNAIQVDGFDILKDVLKDLCFIVVLKSPQ